MDQGLILNIPAETERKTYPVNILRVSFHLLVLTLLELCKVSNGQSFNTMLSNEIFYTFLLLVTCNKKLYRFFVAVLVTLETINAISFSIIHTPLTKSVLAAVDIKWTLKSYPSFIVAGVSAFIICLVISLILPYFSYIISIEFEPLYVFYLILYPSLFSYLYNILNNFQGAYNGVVFNQLDDSLVTKFIPLINEKPRIIQKKDKLKNLIMFQIETFESSVITPTATPFLYNLSQKYLYIDDIDSALYSTWSTAGNLITQCGIPQIVTAINWNERIHETLSPYVDIPCISDYLRTVGYKTFSFAMEGDSLMGYATWKNKKFERTLATINDKELFEYMETKGIELFQNTSKQQNYVSLIYNQDTHPPFEVMKYCKPENPSENVGRQTYNCFDQIIRKFINKYLDLKMYEDTVLVIYGDHLIMGKSFSNSKKLAMLFPGMEKREFAHPSTYYDFAPTLIDMVGIEKISPGFPYGRSLISGKPPSVPSDKDLKFMYHFFSYSLKINKAHAKFYCGGVKGYQDTVCDDTSIGSS